MISTQIVCNILNNPELICLHIVTWFQEFLPNMDNTIYY